MVKDPGAGIGTPAFFFYKKTEFGTFRTKIRRTLVRPSYGHSGGYFFGVPFFNLLRVGMFMYEMDIKIK